MELDDRLKGFVRDDGSGGFRPLEPADLLEDVKDIQLGPTVPQEVHFVLDVAKKLYIAAYFNYEFFTVANHYAFLAVEAAALHRHDTVTSGDRIQHVSLKKALEGLVQEQIIPESQADIFDAVRRLRNDLSHLKEHLLTRPGAGGLERAAELINSLFSPVPPE